MKAGSRDHRPAVFLRFFLLDEAPDGGYAPHSEPYLIAHCA